MATGSGLDAQLGVKDEVTVGTAVTPDHFFEFDNEQLTNQPSYIEGSGIKAGRKFKSVNQAGIARQTANGKVEVPVMMKGFGWWWKHLIGSTANPVQIGTETAYKQIHVPAGLRGVSFTCQIGRPEENTGTVQPYTYNGCKVTDWNLTFADNANTLLDFTVDAFTEVTATGLATASYVTGAQIYNFSHVNNFKIGGTATTASGETTIAGSTAVASVVSSMTITGKNTLETTRYGLGNSGVKKEQLETDFTSITGTFKGEFLQSDFQSIFSGGTTTAIQIDSQGPVIQGSDHYLLSVIMPACKITKAAPYVSGPGLVTVDGEFMVYDPDDGSNPPFQLKYVSTDTVR